jgi:hypothetical protein
MADYGGIVWIETDRVKYDILDIEMRSIRTVGSISTMNDHTPLKLRIPRQDLAECTIFHATADDALAWAQNLPIANTRLVVQNLRAALAELNRVDMAPDVRFNILEALRPSLHVALSTMSRRFLNQPLVMPEEPRQMAELADVLYSLATTGYTIVALQTLAQRDNIYQVNPARLVCESIYRALGFAGKKILQGSPSSITFKPDRKSLVEYVAMEFSSN